MINQNLPVIFKNAPYNKTSCFVMSETYNGCEVYLPMLIDCPTIMQEAKEILDEVLANQHKWGHNGYAM